MNVGEIGPIISEKLLKLPAGSSGLMTHREQTHPTPASVIVQHTNIGGVSESSSY